MSDELFCKNCMSMVKYNTYYNGPHIQARCNNCDTHLCFIKNSKSKNRESKHKELVKQSEINYCEWCMRTKDEIPLPGTLEAHHIVEYSLGGTDDLSNILILCTACHKQCHHDRTYYGHYKSNS